MPNINPRFTRREAIQKKCTEIKNSLLLTIYIFPKLQRQRRESINPLIQTALALIATPILFIAIWAFFCFNDAITANKSLSQLLMLAVILVISPLAMKWIILNKKNIETYKENSEENQDSSKTQESTITKYTPLDHIKYLISLSPSVISLPFILVLMHYKDTLGSNTEIALQITSLKLPQNQQVWIAESLLLLAIIYLTTLPSIALLPSSKFGTHLIFNNTTIHRHENWDILYFYTCLQLSILIFPTTWILNFIFNAFDSESKVLYLTGSITFSFLLGQLSIGYSMLKTIREEKTIPLHEISNNYKGFLRATLVIIALIAASTGNMYINTVYQGVGRLIADPGNSNTELANPYSCVFSGDRQHPEPKAVGILISANASSIHIFTPSFNSKDKKYENIENNSIQGLTESHLEIKKDYYIERYNKEKHKYNEETGVCNYIENN